MVQFSDVYIQQDPPRSSAMPASTNGVRFGEVSHPVASDFAPSSSAFTELLALIQDENKLRFSTAIDLARDIELKIGECLGSETGCYMLVTGVAEDMVEHIQEEMEELGIRQEARFTYEQTMESLIMRLMPGVVHRYVSRSFCFNIQDKVANIPGRSEHSFCPAGATMFHFPDGRTKEGDEGFKPLDRQGDYGEWPSLMVEVGYSGSLPALQCDAQMWIENSGGRTSMVIIIEIAKNPHELRLECWKMIVDPDGSVAGNNIRCAPGFSQYFDIDHSGTVSPAGHDLVIPYCTFFDTSQHGDSDIIISAGELSEWALAMYRLFRLFQSYAE